jgi:hypothetical protein
MLNNYSDHIRECNDIVQDSPAGLVRAGLFVLATIQQQLETVPTILRDFETSGSDSPFAFASKAAGIDFLQDHGRTLWRDTVRLQSDPVELQRVYMHIPGMSLVKTGFLVQLATGHVGCLDVHNIALHSIPASIVRPFNVQKVQPKTATRRIETYQEACRDVGGSEFLWRTWCDHVAALRPGNWQDGLEVSALHVDCLTGRERGAMSGLQSGFEFAPKFRTGFEV